jgi:gas vesicle protein
MEKSNNTGKLVGALVVGAVIGGALGILFAPDKGSETRKKLMSKGEDLKDTISDKISGYMSDRNDGEMARNKAKEQVEQHA